MILSILALASFSTFAQSNQTDCHKSAELAALALSQVSYPTNEFEIKEVSYMDVDLYGVTVINTKPQLQNPKKLIYMIKTVDMNINNVCVIDKTLLLY